MFINKFNKWLDGDYRGDEIKINSKYLTLLEDGYYFNHAALGEYSENNANQFIKTNIEEFIFLFEKYAHHIHGYNLEDQSFLDFSVADKRDLLFDSTVFVWYNSDIKSHEIYDDAYKFLMPYFYCLLEFLREVDEAKGVKYTRMTDLTRMKLVRRLKKKAKLLEVSP